MQGQLTNLLDAVWAKTFKLTARKVKYSLLLPDGSFVEYQSYEDGPSPIDIYLENGDIIDGSEFMRLVLESVPPDHPVYRDALGHEKNFVINLQSGGILIAETGEVVDIYVRESSGAFMAKVVHIEVSGSFDVHVQEVLMTHSDFDGVAYSAGSAKIGDDDVLIVTTQMPDGEQKAKLRVKWGTLPTT
ncbi:hypothetical protein ACQP1G_30595 [Nocardia sp. CA-107356]|uniref:hypothetical protein n=1 Tax=Nocardia sp. CA-107356 TaxID=3239972 RepID=UPI003D8B7D11